MRCVNCNTEMPDGVSFCPACGQQATVQPVYTAPVTRKEFMDKQASGKTKTLSLVAKILSVVCAVLFLVGGFTILNTAITDYPIVTAFLSEDDLDLDMDVATDELENAIDELLDEYGSELSAKDEKILENFLDVAKDFVETPSLNNIKRVFASAESIAEISALEDNDLEELEELLESEEMEMINGALGVVTVVVWGGAILLAIFAILAGFLRSFGWAIPAMILNILPSLLFVGFLHFLAVTALLIALIVVAVKSNTEYNNYKRGIA